MIRQFISIDRLEPGVNVIFMPFSPGVYICLNTNSAIDRE